MKYFALLFLIPIAAFAVTEILFSQYNVNFGLDVDYYVIDDGTWAGWDPEVNQWDFSALSSSQYTTIRVGSTSGMPSAGDFPEADYCEVITYPEVDDMYGYFSAIGAGDTGTCTQYGGFTTSEGYDITADFSSPRVVFDFPMYVGDTWSAHYTFEVYFWPFTFHFEEWHDVEVVGEGIVKVPASGNDWWPCMVILDHFVHIDDFGYDEDRLVYTWVVPNGFAGAGFPRTNGAVSISSVNDETNPQFTSYGSMELCYSTTANPDPWVSLERTSWGSIKTSF